MGSPLVIDGLDGLTLVGRDELGERYAAVHRSAGHRVLVRIVTAEPSDSQRFMLSVLWGAQAMWPVLDSVASIVAYGQTEGGQPWVAVDSPVVTPLDAADGLDWREVPTRHRHGASARCAPRHGRQARGPRSCRNRR